MHRAQLAASGVGVEKVRAFFWDSGMNAVVEFVGIAVVPMK
jgi:hypothetical protein